MLKDPEFHSVVAEIDGRIVGSNFLDERNTIAGIGPITVDPAGQNRTVCAFAVGWYLGEALFGIGVAALLLLFIGIHNAWEALAYHLFARKSK